MSSFTPPPPRQLGSTQIDFLQQQGFSSGLIQALAASANRVPLRLWVMDNSSSMQTNDADQIMGSTVSTITTQTCSRWQEAQGSVLQLCHIATMLQLPTHVIMLNELGRMFGPSTFAVATSNNNNNGGNTLQEQFQNAQTILSRAYPSGATPLTKHIQQIHQQILPMVPQLRQQGQMIAIILATDGLPSDEAGNEGHVITSQFIQALKQLEGLPIWVVVRLCTNDEKVFDFYNAMDTHHTVPYDVLDDFFGEALEVYLRNPWLTYALPLHKFRELGFYYPVLDEIDERALSLTHVRDLCHLLFQTIPLPDPNVDWLSFLRALAQVQAREPWHFNPITKVLTPWIDLRRLHFVYGRNIPFPNDLLQFCVPPPHQQQQHSQQQQQQQHKNMHQAHHYQQQHYQQQQQQIYQQQQQQPPPQQYHQQQQAQQPPYGQGQAQTQYNPFQQQQQPPPPQPPQSHHNQPNQPPPPQQQQQQPPPPKQPQQGPSASKYAAGSDSSNTGSDQQMTSIKHGVLQWAVIGGHLKPIEQLLGSVHLTFPPAIASVATHTYFEKYKPFSMDALQGRDTAVIKRAVRKLKFFLHPDKLPRDFSKEQHYLCKMLWDILADSWETFEQASTT